MSPRMRMVMLILDGIALIGLVIFSVAAALNRDNSVYLAGQILCAAWVLWAVYVLRRTNRRDATNHTTDEESDD